MPVVSELGTIIPITLQQYSFSSSSGTVFALRVLSCAKASRRQKRGKRIYGLSLTKSLFLYLYSPDSGELCSWDLLQLLLPASSAVLRSAACFKILVDLHGEFSASHFFKKLKPKQSNMLESKSICFSWNQILCRERPKYRGSFSPKTLKKADTSILLYFFLVYSVMAP